MSDERAALTIGTVVPSLVCHGRSPDADLLYRHLVTFGPRAAADAARDLGMPAGRVQLALDELAAVGAAVNSASGRRTWAAVEPDAVLEAVRSASAATKRRCRTVLDGRTVARAAGADPLRLGEDLRHLPSRAATRARLAQLVTMARHEHLAMHPEVSFDAEALRAAAPMDRALLDRGVRMRVLGAQQPGAGSSPHTGQTAAARPVYRLAPAPPAKLLIIDRRVALFPVCPDDLEHGYLEVTGEPVISALVSLFEQQWATGVDPPECAMPQIPLSPRERALISLLAAGHTDATAARELRVSPRTVSNVLRDLMGRLGVENRFQLGLVLGAARAAQPAATEEPTEETR